MAEAAFIGALVFAGFLGLLLGLHAIVRLVLGPDLDLIDRGKDR